MVDKPVATWGFQFWYKGWKCQYYGSQSVTLKHDQISYIHFLRCILGARGSVVGWCTMLQAGRSTVRVPDEVNFFDLPYPSSRTMALGLTLPPTKICTSFPGDEKRPARRAEPLAAIYEPNVWQLWKPQPHTTAFSTWYTYQITRIRPPEI
jgi:hypothetical protein